MKFIVLNFMKAFCRFGVVSRVEKKYGRTDVATEVGMQRYAKPSI